MYNHTCIHIIDIAHTMIIQLIEIINPLFGLLQFLHRQLRKLNLTNIIPIQEKGSVINWYLL